MILFEVAFMSGGGKRALAQKILILAILSSNVVTTLFGVLLYVFDAGFDGRGLIRKMIQDEIRGEEELMKCAIITCFVN